MKKIVLKNPDGKCNTFDVDYSEEELADKNDEGWKKLHELKTEKFQDTMAWNEFFERNNKDHMMEKKQRYTLIIFIVSENSTAYL